MKIFLTIGLFLALASVAGALGIGLFAMAKGGEFNRKWGNKAMRARVILQAIAIVLFLLVAAIGGRR